jgi:hypothetical protein
MFYILNSISVSFFIFEGSSDTIQDSLVLNLMEKQEIVA